jgi:hypothetical protein
LLAGNIRTQGEIATRSIVRHNRTVTARLIVGPAASSAALIAAIRNLLLWLAAPPQLPITLQYQPFNASTPLSLDVVGASHNLPADEGQWLRGQFEPITISFLTRPGLRDARVTLQNLVANAGFEQPSSGGFTAFNDTFANANFYATQAGSAPSVAANVMTIPNGTRVGFGSPVWGALNRWQVRFKYATGEVADVQATLYNDAAGSVGSQVATLGPAPTVNGSTVALSGPMVIFAGGADLAIGGAFANVQLVNLFGPGGWQLDASAGGSIGSAAWEGQGQNTANTYPSGPVSSLGAGRFDAPPTGAWDILMHGYNGGAPTGTWAIPAAVAQTLAGSLYVKSNGLAGSASLSLLLREYDASGSFLRSSTLQTVSGNQASWTQLAGTATTGANCAYVDLALRALDATSNSANGTLWLDNAQLWNKTQLATMSAMPWCDLRAVVSPAMLVVSGLVGDLPAPCYLALGTYVASLPTGGALSLYVGRKAITSPRAQLVGASFGAFSAAFSPQGFAQLDASSYGGFDSFASVGAGGWNPKALSLLASDAAGIYHLLARVKTAQTVPNLPLITLRVATAQQTDAWFNQVGGADIVGQWTGQTVTPFSQQNVWTIADAGQCNLPPFPQGALTDPSQLFLIPRSQWQDSSGGGAQNGYANWQALLPIDGSLLVATVNNPSNSAGAITNSWLWSYSDGLLLNRSAASDGPAWTYSVETKAQPNPAVGAGGSGTQSSGAINVNSGADPCLTIDPAQVGANNSVGVNQLVAIVSDQAGGVYSCFGEVSYSPLYLEPR